MELITNEKLFPAMICYPVTDEITPEEILYFDIETTGFHADSSYLSMIGTVAVKKKTLTLTQFITEDITEEKELIISFFTLLKNYKLLIHYNGSAFDLPYLLKKSKFYHLPHSFSGIKTLDIYKEIKPFKKLFGLENLKLKTVEEYLGIHRRDPYTGEDLIDIYIQFIGRSRFDKFHKKATGILSDYKQPPKNSGLSLLPSCTAHEFLQMLLLHNEEDLTGLISCMELLYLIKLFAGNFDVLKTAYSSCAKHLEICISPEKTGQFPELPYHFTNNSYSLWLPFYPSALSLRFADGLCTLFIPSYEGEMKYFFPDYKEYYYLPEEDTAIHKSIAQYVEKAYRQKAKKSNCYQKKQGAFLPQPKPSYTPEFRQDIKDKITYFEITEEFMKDVTGLKKYIRTMFHPDIS